MSLTADYHLHSSFSGDCTTQMEEMILVATKVGLQTICFTEHMDMDYAYNEGEDENTFILNTDSYLYDLLKYKEKYASQIKILFGVELGVQPQLKRQLAVYAKNYDFDFIIASSHVCNGTDPYNKKFFEEKTDEEAYREYFSNILTCLKTFGNFDVYGHLDYVVRYGQTKDTNYCYDKYQDVLDPILETLLEMEKGLELNTGGFDYGLKELNPSSEILKRYRKLGGEIITVGSDSHQSSTLKRNYDAASQILLDCGFKYYTTFEKRTPEFHRI